TGEMAPPFTLRTTSGIPLSSLLQRVTVERIAIAVWLSLCVVLVVKNAVSPNSHSLYPQYAQAARSLAGTSPPRSVYSVQHLPYFADLLIPFGLFPDWLGSNLWFLVSLATLITGFKAFIDRFGPVDGRTRAWMVLVVLVVGLPSLANNQSNIII